MQAAAQNAEGIRVLVLLAAIAIMAFWRTAIRLVFILVVTAIIAAIGYGAIAIYQTMHTI
jgi:Tfp pilus assembly protein PilO